MIPIVAYVATRVMIRGVSDENDKKTPGRKVPPVKVKSEIIDTMGEMAVIPFFVDADEEEAREEVNTPTIQEMASEEDMASFDDDDDDTVRIERSTTDLDDDD